MHDFMKIDKMYIFILAIIILGTFVPPLMHWWVTQVPMIECNKAKDILMDAKSNAILVDVRPAEEFKEFSVENSINIPFGEIYQSGAEESWIKKLKDKEKIFVICNSGVSSAIAVKKFHAAGLTQAVNVDGGIDAWIAGGKNYCGQGVCHFKTASGLSQILPRKEFSMIEQITVSIASFGLKPLYEILALIIALLLWRATAEDLVAVRRGMLAFFLGENGCAINFLFFNDQSFTFEYFHSFGMLVAFSFITYGAIYTLDARILGYSDRAKKCALLPMCIYCYKHNDISCNLRQIFLLAMPAAMVLCFIPLSARIKAYAYIGNVLGTDLIFGHSSAWQFTEVRVCPILALIALAIAWVILFWKKEEGFHLSKIFFSMGVGCLGFSIMRFMMYWAYDYNSIWADSWEELTEMLFIAFVLFIIIKYKLITRKLASTKSS